MKITMLAGLLFGFSGAAFAQTSPAANPSPTTPAVTRPSTPAPSMPAAGSNSFTMDQAKSRIEAAGYTQVSVLTKDQSGVWRGTAAKGGATHDVSLDYQGNVLPK